MLWLYLVIATLLSFIWYGSEISLSCATYSGCHIHGVSYETELWFMPSNHTSKNFTVMNSDLNFQSFLFFSICNCCWSFHDLMRHEDATDNWMKFHIFLALLIPPSLVPFNPVKNINNNSISSSPICLKS